MINLLSNMKDKDCIFTREVTIRDCQERTKKTLKNTKTTNKTVDFPLPKK